MLYWNSIKKNWLLNVDKQIAFNWKEIEYEKELYSTGHYLITNEMMNSILEDMAEKDSWEVTIFGNGQAIHIDSLKSDLVLHFNTFKNPGKDEQQYIMEGIVSSGSLDLSPNFFPVDVRKILERQKNIEYKHF